MSNEVRVYPVQALNEALTDSLSRLLIDVVANGASIGFLPPIRLSGSSSLLEQCT